MNNGNYSESFNMPNVSMIDLGIFRIPVHRQRRKKTNQKQEKPVNDFERYSCTT